MNLDNLNLFFAALLMFVSLLNPIQKIFVIFSLQETYNKDGIRTIVNRSTRTALIVLLLFLALGNEILISIFRIEIYSFQIICGIVLAISGLTALQKGAYVRVDKGSTIDDVVTVPIAVPMIAGPASITAVVTMPMIYGVAVSLLAVIIGISINWLVMRHSDRIGAFLKRYNLLNPMSRIIGLIVASIGMQMALNGLADYIHTL